jgi:tRNA modification GTPase
VASITGNGPTAVAVVRVSGPKAFEVAKTVFSPWPQAVKPRYALVGSYEFGEQGIALPFVAGSSFTGQETVELSIHGGNASIRALLDACVLAGARAAMPGEFSLRAFLNGTIDLSQAEAIADMVEAQTSRQLRLAGLNLHGALKKRVEALIEELSAELAKIEATIDFSEEIGDYDFEAAARNFGRLAHQINDIEEQGRLAHRSRSGLRFAIMGRPNAGKSSLLNAMLGTDRAIVTPVPGTTRDTIEESVDWEGLQVVLIDTAGIRESEEQIESLGVARSLQQAMAADEVLYLFDSTIGWSAEDAAVLEQIGRPVTLVGNKADLQKPDRGISVSAKTGQGLELLRRTIASKYLLVADFPPTNDRQSSSIQLARTSVTGAQNAVAAYMPIDVLGVLVKDAIDHLGRVIGRTASDDMLSEIFSRFCIGK